MPVLPNMLEKILMLKTTIAPGPFIDIVNAWSFPPIHAALKLNLFDTLGTDAFTVEEVAKRIEASEVGTGHLLKALVQLGYVKESSNRYSNTKITLKWLLSSSPSTLAPLFDHFQDTLDAFKYLDESIKLGKPANGGIAGFLSVPERAENFHKAMLTLARSNGPEIVKKIKLSGNEKTILDIGGSHGLYAINLLKANPHIESAEILDWPEAEKLALKTITDEGVKDKVSFRLGDYLKDDLSGKEYDVLLLMNIVHMHTRDTLESLFSKFYNIMAPGGTIVLLEQIGKQQPGNIGKAISTFMSLNQLNLSGGQAYTESTLKELLSKVGFGTFTYENVLSSPGFGLLTAHKN